MMELEQEHIDYLNRLRDLGIVNMFGAGSYLEENFDMNSREAKNILLAWMELKKKEASQ